MNTLQIEKLFPNFENDLYEEISKFAVIEQYKKGEILLHVEQIIRACYLVAEGVVKVYRENDEGLEFFIYLLTPGEACATSLACAIYNQTSKVLVKAITDVTVLAIPIKLTDEWIKKYRESGLDGIRNKRERMEVENQ